MTPSEIQDAIFAAEYKVALLVDANAVALQGGNEDVQWGRINNAYMAINSVQSQYDVGIYDTPALGCLLNFIGTDTANPINPNAQVGGITVITDGGFEPITTEYDQDDLIDFGGGNWYLPILITGTQRVVSVTSNGATIDENVNYTTSPAKIFGFADASAQVIVVTVV